MKKIVLYQYPGSSDLPSVSPPCVKVYLALRLIGADHEVVDLFSATKAKKVSTTGRLPVADIDGRLIPDSVDIMDALENEYPAAGLSPEDPRQAMRDRLWEHFVNDHMYFVGFYLRWVANADRTIDAMFRQVPWYVKLGVRYQYLPGARRRANLHGIGGKDESTVHRNVERAFAMLAEGLEGGPFLQGRQAPARGDLAAAGMLAQIGWRNSLPHILERLDRHPELRGYTARVFEKCDTPPPKWLRRLQPE